MIEKSYPSTRKVWQVGKYWPGHHGQQQQSPNVVVPITQSNHGILAASMRGIDVAEYQRRDALIRKQSAESGLYKGTQCYPRNPEDYVTYGAMRVTEVAWSYADLPRDHVWDSDFPKIITCYPVADPAKVLLANAAWLSKTAPDKESTC